ncbi:MAG: MMPL family transporter [Verrucomicrobiales bacterium]|jgi:predicted exporter|nr:MMPL family transporter [Verrucomicrobiales bacterium]
MNFVLRHRRLFLAVLIIGVTLAALGYKKITLNEDVTVMVPDALAPEVALFQDSPLARKIFVVVGGADADAARQAADAVTQAMTVLHDVKSLTVTPDFLLKFLRYAPVLFDDELRAQIEPLTAPQNISAKMTQNVRALAGPEGIFLQPLIVSDPLGFLPVFAERFKALSVGGALDASGGYLSSPDGATLLLVFDSTASKFDQRAVREINTALAVARAQFPPGARAFLMGTARYTQENQAVVERDLKRVLPLTVILMAAIFLVFFRERRALLLYALPPLTVLVAAVVTASVFGSLSGITLGFSAVLLGMASDYSAYVWFALRGGREEQRVAIVSELRGTILLSAGTLLLSFALLALAGIALFRQLAFFSACGILLEVFVALCVAPGVFRCQEKPERTLTVKTLLGKKTALIVTALLIVSGLAAVPFVKFNFQLDALNTVSAECRRDRAEFDQLTGSVQEKNAFLFVFGDNEDEAIRHTEKLSAQMPEPLPLTKLFVSPERAAENYQRWQEFWYRPESGIDYADLTMMRVGQEAKKHGLKPAAFAPFQKLLADGGDRAACDLRELYNPFIVSGSRVAMVSIIPENTAVPADRDVPTLLVSAANIHRVLAEQVFTHIGVIMAALFALCLALLARLLRNWRQALLCFVPCWCGMAAFFLVLALTRAECNLFGFFIFPMLLGLGINYGIFIVRQQTHRETHPTKAVLATALTTLVGFGTLMFAQHKVLFIMGLGAFTGVLTAMMVSVLLLPPLLSHLEENLHH